MTLVKVDELVNYMSEIRLSAAQYAAAEYILAGVEAEIESYLGRPIMAGRQVGETAYASANGFLRLAASPVTFVESISVFNTPLDPSSWQPVPGGIYLAIPYLSAPGLFLEIREAGNSSGSTEQIGVPFVITYTGGLPPSTASQIRLEVLRIAAREMQNHHDDTFSIAGGERADPAPILPVGIDDQARERLSRLRRRVAI